MKAIDKELQQYYESEVYLPGMEPFGKLSEDEKRQLRQSLGFTGWNLHKATLQLGTAVKGAVERFAEQHPWLRKPKV